MRKEKQTFGFSLPEAVVVMVTLSIVFTGVTTLFKNTIRMAQTKNRAFPAERETRQALHVISKDLEKAMRTSAGNLVLNGTCEEPDDPIVKNYPKFWDQDSTPGGLMRYVYNSGETDMTHSGFGSIRLAYPHTSLPRTRYASNRTTYPIRLSTGTAYWVTAWVRSQIGPPLITMRLRNATFNTELGSDIGSGSDWNMLSFRYPSVGWLTTAENVYIDFQFGPSTGVVLIDDVAVTADRSVLASPYSSFDVIPTMRNSVTNNFGGYMYDIWDGKTLLHYRLRIDDTNQSVDGLVLIKERIEPLANGGNPLILEWMKLAKWVRQFSIDYITPDLDPLTGRGDGDVDMTDEALMDAYLTSSTTGKQESHPAWNPYFDLDRDGVINITDRDLLRSIRQNNISDYLARKDRELRVLLETRTPIGYKEETKIRLVQGGILYIQ